jgi:ribose/xylose/arabinose/galactoside ABC-type transport system permease subunit
MITMLESGLVLSGVSGSFTQGVRGLVILGAVLLTGFLNERFMGIHAKNDILAKASA